jgi:hypothetical protein
MDACFALFYGFGNGPFGWPITKNIMKSLSLSQVKITFFTLFYTYTILHDCVKLYKCICFTLTQSVNKFQYGFTLTWSVCPKPLACTTLVWGVKFHFW